MADWSVRMDPMPPSGCGAPATVAICRGCGAFDLTIDDHDGLRRHLDDHTCKGVRRG